MSTVNPGDLSVLRRIAADTRWAFTDDRRAATAPARKAFMDRFEHEVDPEGRLAPDERAKRATNLKRAYFSRLALQSAQARRRTVVKTDADRKAGRGRPEGVSHDAERASR